MREHLDERVLNRLVRIVRVAQLVVGDSTRTPLLAGDELGKTLACGVAVTRNDQRLDRAC
jgi:hypothetical protein